MKRIFLGIAFLIVFIFIFVYTGSAEEEKKSYTFGMLLNFGTEMDAQNKVIYSDIVNAFSQKAGIDIQFRWFNSNDDFIKEASSGNMSFFYTAENSIVAKLLEESESIPIMTAQFLGKKDFAYCIYVNKESNFKTVGDLSDKNISLEADSFRYYNLRNILNEKPDIVFNSFLDSPSPMSLIYSLALNTTDAIFTSDVTLLFMKMNNPGPIKKIVPLVCTESLPSPPIMVSKKVPQDFVSQISSFLASIMKEELLKKYIPLLQTYKMQFRPVTRDDYKRLMDFYKKAKKLGWDKDYEYWIKTVKSKE